MEFRHEWKHEISYSDMLTLRHRLNAVCQLDPHTKDGLYHIRSLYFDTPTDKALREKVDGVNIRDKFRIRYYNGDTSFIHLEKKSKLNSLCRKVQTRLTAEQAQKIVDGDIEWMADSRDGLIIDLYHCMRGQCLQPKTIVDYTREPYIFTPGNVRVTLDYNIRTGLLTTDFLDTECVTVPAGDSGIILEVKWDEFLPSIIRDAVNLEGRHSTAFSKYAACRVYG